MPCFGSKRVEVVPSIRAPDDGKPTTPGRKGAGRLEGEGGKNPRDGLHSAPTSLDVNETGASTSKRAGLHSAPLNDPSRKGKKSNWGKGQGVVDGEAAEKTGGGQNATLGEFIIENIGSDGQPNAASVDAYLDDVIGPKIVKELRGTEWAGRVQGLEALQGLVKRTAAEGAYATGEDAAEPAEGEPTRQALFRACVTVLARALQDKVVPVYLPALALLAEIYAPAFLAPLGPESTLPRSAVALFAEKLVFRAGSSNVRAQQETSGALLSLARCEMVGPAAVGPSALKPLSNSKSAHAAVGRLELLRTLVSEFGVGAAVGLELKPVLNFALLYVEGSGQVKDADKSRDAAVALVLDLRASHSSVQVDKLIEQLRPTAMPIIKARLAPPDTGKGSVGLGALAVSGKKLPPLGPIGGPASIPMPGSMPVAESGEEVIAMHSTPPDASSRARARTTATELGVRNAPPNKKKGASRGSRNGKQGSPHAYEMTEEDDESGLLNEALSLVGDVPAPRRMAQPTSHASSDSPPRGPRKAKADIDMTEDELIASIVGESLS